MSSENWPTLFSQQVKGSYAFWSNISVDQILVQEKIHNSIDDGSAHWAHINTILSGLLSSPPSIAAATEREDLAQLHVAAAKEGIINHTKQLELPRRGNLSQCNGSSVIHEVELPWRVFLGQSFRQGKSVSSD